MSDQVNAAGHVTNATVVEEIAFVRPIPILGSHERRDRFYASEGWHIEVTDFGVTLSKPASQNVPEIPAFFTCGVGFSVPAAVLAPAVVLEEETVRALPVEGIGGACGIISESALGNATITGEQLLASGATVSIGDAAGNSVSVTPLATRRDRRK